MLGLLLLLTSVVGFQQAATPPTTAEIVGTVFDREGGIIPGVTVSLQTPDGITIHKAITNITGDYRLEKIAPGTYSVSFELLGFQTYTRPRLALTRGQSHTLKVAIVTGVVSMARGTAADTATSDFFILLDDQPSLDFGGQRFDDGQGGAAFGRVVEGLDIVRKIQQQPVEGQNLSGPVTIGRVWRLGGK